MKLGLGRRARRVALVVALAAAAGVFAVPRPPLLEGVGTSRLVRAADGSLLRLTLAPDGRYRLRVSLDRVPDDVTRAVLLHEDRWFHWHPGVNPVSLLRATWRSTLGGGPRQGASTITMQLVRLRDRLPTRSVSGKLRQIVRAVALELHYSKREILEAYLTLAPYGGNVEGVRAAALVYFGVDVERLGLPEALALAVVPQSPERRHPGQHPEALARARAALLARWQAHTPVPPEIRAAFRLPLDTRGRDALPRRAPHFTQAVLDASSADTLQTTLDPHRQQLLESLAGAHVERLRSRGITNVAALLVDSRTGAVRAHVGSADFDDVAIQGQVDGARAPRSPGSTLKPFVYALALDQGVIHPRTMLVDAPRSFGGFDPENYDGGFAGPLSATEALVRSRNVPAVSLAGRLRSPRFHGFLERAGIAGLREWEFYGLATVLGGMELTMEELVGLYAMLANGGDWRPLRRVADSGDPAPHRRLLGAEAAHLVLDMLESAPRPGHAERSVARGAIAWKTGTSYGHRDAWTVGVFGPWVLGVWAGNFDGRGDPALVGREAAAPLFFAIADALAADAPEPAASQGRSAGLHLARVPVCAVSGRLPGAHCPHTVETGFIPGVSPIERCRVHRAVAIDPDTGLRSCGAEARGLPLRVYEFWPTDLLAVFDAAGVPRRVPPAYGPECTPRETAGQGRAPVIRSPKAGVTYALRAGRVGDDPIPLMAVTDADARTLHWFLDREYLGRARAREAFYWTARPGDFTLRAVDDHGRSGAVSLRVAVVD